MNRRGLWLLFYLVLGLVALITFACWSSLMVLFVVSVRFGYPLDSIVRFSAFLLISAYLSIVASLLLCVVACFRLRGA